MKIRFVLFVAAFCATVASANAAGYWVQLAAGPPGSTGVDRVDTVEPPAANPGTANPTPTPTPQQPATNVPVAIGGGVVAVPIQGGMQTGTQPQSGAPALAPGQSSGPLPATSVPPFLRGPGNPSAPGAGPASGPGASGTPAPGQAGSPNPAAPTEAGAISPAPPLPPGCNVVLTDGGATIPASGGVFEVNAQFSPATCRTAPVPAANWIQAVPAGASGAFRFAVPPNPLEVPRSTTVGIGPHRFTVRQEGGRPAAFAASPSKLIFSVQGKKVSGAKTITIWGDDPATTYSVAAATPGNWLVVKPLNSKKGRRFELSVNPAALRAGRYEVTLEVAAAGAASPPLRIPVIVEVFGR